MASLADAEGALRSTSAKANFQRLTRLLMCGGLRLLRETFDSIHSPADLPLRLRDPAIQTQLRGARLTQPERNLLNPSPGVYGKSTDFDITLIFRLLRTICSLTPPPGPRGWDDLPNSTDHSLEADLVRIKYYRNEVYGHSKTMEITDTEFHDLWRKISGALIRIAASISREKKDEWKKSIDDFLVNPLTPEEDRYIEELNTWYKQDMDVKSEVEKLREELKTLIGDLKEEVAKQSQRPVTLVLNITAAGLPPILNQLSGRPQVPQEAGESHEIGDIPVPNQERAEEEVSDSGELQLNPLDTPTEIQIWRVILSFKRSFALFLQYLGCKLNVFVRNHGVGSLLITVECSSLQILEGLWEDYCSGHLNAIAQEILVTAEVLEKLGLDEVRLKTFISEEEYEKGKQIFMDHSELTSPIEKGKDIGDGSPKKSQSITKLHHKRRSEGRRRKEPASVSVYGSRSGNGSEEKQTVKEKFFSPERTKWPAVHSIRKPQPETLRVASASTTYIPIPSSEDYLERISNLEKENAELKRRIDDIEKDLHGEKLRNSKLDMRIKTLERRQRSPLIAAGMEKGRGFDEPSHSPLPYMFTQDPYASYLTYPFDMDVPGRSFGKKKGLCQVIVNRQKLEALDEEKVEFKSVFEDFGFDVDEKVCESKDDVEWVIDYVASRDHSDYNRFVCFIQSSVTKDWEIESFDGSSWSVTELIAKFSFKEVFPWQKMPKIFIIQGHPTTTARQAGEPLDEKSSSVKLPSRENVLCLFVPYRKGYISTLLSVIKLHGSKPVDILYILSEAKKLFYEKNHITISDPVHNLTRPVYLMNWEI